MSRLLKILLTTVLLATPLAAQDSRSLHWREIQVTAHLDEDGRLRIRERQAMVFDGPWNGGERRFDVRPGQQLELHGVTRIDAASGESIALTRSEPDQVDEYDWAEEHLLRWRSRADSDPPFSGDEIVYELDYSIWPVLAPEGDGEYELRHDFAFADRAGVIERFQVDLTLDDAWSTPFGNHIQETAAQLEPGRGYVLTVPLTRAAGEPALAGSEGAPALIRIAVGAGALAVPLLVLLGLRRRGRELDLLAPLVPHDDIDAAWLEREIFSRPAEVVGTAWDRAVGGAEVSALLARLVGEGKLSSRVEEEDGEPVLHLRRLARGRRQPDAETGSVTFVQRYGGGLNLNVHYHLLCLDGWFHRRSDGQLAFVRAPPPSQTDVERLVVDVHARVMTLLERRGLLEADASDALAEDGSALSACYEGAVLQRVALGPMRGRPVMKLGQPLSAHLASAATRVEHGGRLCARLDGFDLHGQLAFGAVAEPPAMPMSRQPSPRPGDWGVSCSTS